jgi:hypothetical protein
MDVSAVLLLLPTSGVQASCHNILYLYPIPIHISGLKTNWVQNELALIGAPVEWVPREISPEIKPPEREA